MSSPAMMLQRLRAMQVRNGWRAIVRGSRMRPVTIAVACAVVWVSLFVGSLFAFWDLKTRWNFPLDGLFQQLLFDLMFFFLSVLLLFSTGILVYTSLFASDETKHLLITPTPDDHLFAYKFQGALAFSSWGFLLLGSPILIAYGIELEPKAPWHFFLVMPCFFVGFVLMPGAVGAMVCLLLVNFLPRNARQLAQAAAWALGAIALVVSYRWLSSYAPGFRPTRAWFESFIGELSTLSGELMPHHWVAAGLKASALGDTPRMLRYLSLVCSHGLAFYLAAVWTGQRLTRRGVDRVLTGGTLLGTQVRESRFDRFVLAALFFLDRPTRLLIVKDLRTFRRDPAQWLQISIFVGLLLFYFWGMRRFFERDIDAPYKNGISLMTLLTLSLLLCAYAGRFVFPLLSLEGRTFWMLGLLPLDRTRLVWGKFAFAATTCLAPSVTLMATCDAILRVPFWMAASHVTAATLVPLGLAGLSVGLGTLMPNFREPDPSKIAIGFGGTLNLVAGFLYLLVVIGLLVVPIHLFYVGKDLGYAGPLPWWLGVLAAAGVVIGLVGAYLPLRWGARHLATLEF